MLAEAIVNVSRSLLKGYAPEGRAHWAAKPWDRTVYELAPRVGPDLEIKKDRVGELVDRYGRSASRLLEFASGTGAHTAVAARNTDAREIVAVDICADALRLAEKRVDDPRLRTIHGDFWDPELDVPTADLVMCINAIHHIGDVREVIEKLKTHVEPGGVLIGTVLTMDHFHEFQRDVHGSAAHLARSALFLANAVSIKLTRGRVRWASYRSQLVHTHELERIVRSVAPEVLHISHTRYISCFAIRC